MNDTGGVSGFGVGTVTIKASFQQDGREYSAMCTAKVGPATGIYRVRNVNSGLYLDVTSGSIANLANTTVH